MTSNTAPSHPLTLAPEMAAYRAPDSLIEAEVDRPVTLKDLLAFRQALIDIPRLRAGDAIEDLAPLPSGLNLEQARAYDVGKQTVEHLMKKQGQL